ncbi:MAG: hypothetical protein IJ072_07155 [Oscillospiraceae bacterium]|nr:hypothetical protein [Oscillospiraceae bacterium]
MEVFSQLVTLPKTGQRLTMAEIFKVFERVASDHVDSLGLGREFFDARGSAWVLTSEHLCFKAPIVPGSTVKISTWAGETKFALFPRYFLMEDEGGAELAGAGSLWSIMDLKQRRILFPEENGVKVEGVVTGRETPLPKNIRSVKAEPELTMTVTPEDIDANGHMNNAVYLDWLERALPEEVLSGDGIGELTIIYKKELLLGDSAHIRVDRRPGGFTMQGLHDGKPAFSVAVEYKDSIK